MSENNNKYIRCACKMKTFYLYFLIFTWEKNAHNIHTFKVNSKSILRFKHDDTVASKNNHPNVVSVSWFCEPIRQKKRGVFNMKLCKCKLWFDDEIKGYSTYSRASSNTKFMKGSNPRRTPSTARPPLILRWIYKIRLY